MITFNSARLPAYFFTKSARFCSRLISASFAMAASVSEREFKCGEERFRFVVGFRCRGNADVHATQRVDFVVLNFGENNLLFNPDIVVTTTVKGAARHAAKVTYARQCDSDQAIEKL